MTKAKNITQPNHQLQTIAMDTAKAITTSPNSTSFSLQRYKNEGINF